MNQQLRNLSLATALLLVFLCTACQATPSGADTPTSVIQGRADSATISDRINNDAPYLSLITASIDLDDSLLDYLFSQELYPHTPTIEQSNKQIKIECLRESQPPPGYETKSLYSVHKVQQGGLLYLYYREATPGYEKGKGSMLFYHWLYVQKDLALSDFASIKEGSLADDVMAIDPVTAVYLDRALHDKESLHAGFRSQHYLRDGLLSITYAYKNGKYVVERITNRPLFQMFEDGMSTSEAVCAQVLEQDTINGKPD